MVRSRVRSFMSAFGSSPRSQESADHSQLPAKSASVTTMTTTTMTTTATTTPLSATTAARAPLTNEISSPDAPSVRASTVQGASTPTRDSSQRYSSRPASMAFTYSPPLMDVAEDTPLELQPIFTFLNSHANKLYLEGYLLKLNDLDTHGRPCADRQWVECYAQLVGTVLSLWDAAALDAAAQEGEIPPTFMNLADASIRMIETLPTRSGDASQSLKNILSISSAGRNRFLLHFNSFHSLVQWTAAIRLAMFEHTSLYEAYTGSIIAGKGKQLNNIRAIMERSRFKYADWARVRFGAGTPWRRCWFVITPPDAKEIQKLHKSSKKKSAYSRNSTLVTGEINFYDKKKTKKSKPIATVRNVYSAYAIYPQSKPLIDQSTLVKLEGHITVHSRPESASEGFVFVMPEVHPAIPGFEMMLRFLFPTFDTFNLYGRPTRLIADTNNLKSIMFAFPKRRRYGYLEVLDVISLIQTGDSQKWSEAEWRRQLKEATARRMAASPSETSSMAGSNPRQRSSLPARSSRFSLGRTISPETRPDFNQSADAIIETSREETGNPTRFGSSAHHRGLSDTTGLVTGQNAQHTSALRRTTPQSSDPDLAQEMMGHDGSPLAENNKIHQERSSSESDRKDASQALQNEMLFEDQLRPASPPTSISLPPAFAHGPGHVPATKPQPSPELKMASRMSYTTLSQLASAGKLSASNALNNPAWTDDLSRSLGQTERPTGNLDTLADGQVTTSRADVLDIERHNNFSSPYSAQGPPVPQHLYAATPTASDTNNSSPNPPPGVSLGIDKGIKRKPLPNQQVSNSGAAGAAAESSSEDILSYVIDEAGLNKITASGATKLRSPVSDIHMDDESVYDNESTASPDYASTHESIHSKQSAVSVARPRMGVMKTVGEVPKQDLVIGDAHYSREQPKSAAWNIPTVDFGPTLAYMPTTGRPNTSDTLKKFDHQRRGSDQTEKVKRHSISDATGMNSSDHSRTNSPGRDGFRPSGLRWQPGMATTVGRPTSGGSAGLTPEQYVEQRAAVTSSPPPLHLAHRKSSSVSPPLARPPTGQRQPHSRSHSNLSDETYFTRPHSRGAGSVMNYDEISSHLSAREQEHVARMTGSAFFNLSSETQKTQIPVNPTGLVSTIEAREREKRAIRDGLSNQMVQHAIAHRQHHFQQQEQPSTGYLPYSPPLAYGALPPQPGPPQNFYALPGASHTLDALTPANRGDEPRRQSWYGVYGSQVTPSPPVHHHSPYTNPQSGYF